MSRDLQSLLRDAAPEPTFDVDERRLVDRALRQRLLLRIGTAALMVAVLAAVAAAVASTPLSRVPGLEVLAPDDDGAAEAEPNGRQQPQDSTASEWRELPASPLGPRHRHVMVEAAEHVIVWGGVDDAGSADPFSSTGALYDPADDAWRPIAHAPIQARHDALAVWTGDEMLLWGGRADTSTGHDQAALYDPASDSWREAAGFPSIPAGSGVAVWTGRRVLVWGQPLGTDPTDTPPVTAAYDPEADRWTELAEAPIMGGSQVSGVWTGDELIVFGGARPDADGGGLQGSRAGAAYDPSTDTWRTLPDAPIEGRFGHTMVWTGSEIIVWGGTRTDEARDVLDDGAAYDPKQDRWRELASAPLGGRYNHFAVWTGTHMVVFGGQVRTSGSTWAYPQDTAAYNPATQRWFDLPHLPSGIDWWNVKAVSLPDRTIYWGEHNRVETAGALPHQTLPNSPTK